VNPGKPGRIATMIGDVSGEPSEIERRTDARLKELLEALQFTADTIDARITHYGLHHEATGTTLVEVLNRARAAEETANQMIGDLNVKQPDAATREESDRILRRYSNDSLRRENEAFKAAALELCDALEGVIRLGDLPSDDKTVRAEARLRALLGLKETQR